jgi:3-(3-hydroxy-phenyl)propionate hydroxylase
MDCEVLICGLGPVGQLLALHLGQLGVKTIAIDEAAAPYELPRAAVVDDEVLRIFQGVGLDQAVLRDAQVQPKVSFMTTSGRTAEILDTESGEFGQPPLVSIHQPSIERTMVAALEERGEVELRWGWRLEGLERSAEQVTVSVRPTGGGAVESLRCPYLIGCDGGRSAVRGLLRIAFGGSTFVQRWLVVDGLVDRPIAAAPHPHFLGDPRRPTVSLPMSPGRHRWEWMLHAGEPEAPFLKQDRIRALLVRWLGEGEKVEIERAIVYTFHARVAERWRAGRVLLAGDAAHVMPPFVGQGFSSGARDAANLAWKLDAVLRGAPTRLLDTYEAERRPHVRSMQQLAVRFGGLVQTTRPRGSRCRDLAIEIAERTGVLGWARERAKPLPTYGSGAFASAPHPLPFRRDVGALFPQPDRIDDRLGRGWAAVGASPQATANWRAAGLRAVELPGDPWLRRHRVDWALLRPDRFVFAAGGPAEVGGAVAALRTLVGDSFKVDQLSTKGT